MVNINLFSGPGVGKSVLAAELFSEFKKRNIKVELVTEYAKDLVYSKDFFRLQDQLYILAKQHHPWFKLKNQIDLTINDGPFLLGLIYLQDKDNFPSKEFEKFIIELWKSYDNINIFLERNLEFDYEEYGREQNLQESIDIDNRIKTLLDDNDIRYISIKAGSNILDICKTVLDEVSFIDSSKD